MRGGARLSGRQPVAGEGYWLAALLTVVALSFFVNMAFVVVSRTALVTMPIMLAVFALLHLRWRSNVVILCAAACCAWWRGGVAATAATAERSCRDTRIYKEQNSADVDRPAAGILEEVAAVFCRGAGRRARTGSTRGLFEQAATGSSSDATGEVIGNPHNQTLNVAVQWGIVGVVVLYAMWLVASAAVPRRRPGGLDRPDGGGAEIFTSLFNSHLFDFHEGWMYVLGVGVAGGMALKAKARAADAPSHSRARQRDDRWHGREDGLSAARNVPLSSSVISAGTAHDASFAIDLAKLPDRDA